MRVVMEWVPARCSVAVYLLTMIGHSLVWGDSPCQVNDCVMGSTCTINGNGQAYCKCEENSFGEFCQFRSDTDLCEKKACMNGGQCGQEEDSAIALCFCVPGYHGMRCEKEYNECESNPCVQGDCEDRLATYQCNCDAGWRGTNCEMEDDSSGEKIQAKISTIIGVVTATVIIACILVAVLVYRQRHSVWWMRRQRRVGDSCSSLDSDHATVSGWRLPLTQVRSRIIAN